MVPTAPMFAPSLFLDRLMSCISEIKKGGYSWGNGIAFGECGAK